VKFHVDRTASGFLDHPGICWLFCPHEISCGQNRQQYSNACSSSSKLTRPEAREWQRGSLPDAAAGAAWR
jgi:hypothetical protein